MGMLDRNPHHRQPIVPTNPPSKEGRLTPLFRTILPSLKPETVLHKTPSFFPLK
jgi:hypothetical protein